MRGFHNLSLRESTRAYGRVHEELSFWRSFGRNSDIQLEFGSAARELK
jgi:hypothetical protein